MQLAPARLTRCTSNRNNSINLVNLGQTAYDASRGDPVGETTSFIARLQAIPRGSPRADLELSSTRFRLHIFGYPEVYFACHLQNLPETAEGELQFATTFPKAWAPGPWWYHCRVRVVPVTPLYLEPYTIFPSLGRIVLTYENVGWTLAVGVVESVERE